LLSESPAEALQPVQDHLVHIHIGNAYMDDQGDPAYGDMHPRFGYPGSANDVPEIVTFLNELFKIGYLKRDGSTRAAISFELKPVGAENPRTMIANGQRKLIEAWSQVTP
jgi:sugar phosphate isomerase/epimerase